MSSACIVTFIQSGKISGAFEILSAKQALFFRVFQASELKQVHETRAAPGSRLPSLA